MEIANLDNDVAKLTKQQRLRKFGLGTSVTPVNHWKQKEKQFDERFAFYHKVTNQIGLLILVWVGILTALGIFLGVSAWGIHDVYVKLTR